MRSAVFMLLACIFTVSASAEVVGRIKTAHDPIRCVNRELSAKRVLEKRERTLLLGCVTREEYDALHRNSLCPVCNWKQKGLKAYGGYCPQGCFAKGTPILVKDLADGATKWEVIEKIAHNK